MIIMDHVLGRNDEQIQCRGVLHIVEAGDTLYKIGKKYGVPVSRVMYANPYVNIYNLQPGDEICVPLMAPRAPLGENEVPGRMPGPMPGVGMGAPMPRRPRNGMGGPMPGQTGTGMGGQMPMQPGGGMGGSMPVQPGGGMGCPMPGQTGSGMGCPMSGQTRAGMNGSIPGQTGSGMGGQMPQADRNGMGFSQVPAMETGNDGGLNSVDEKYMGTGTAWNEENRGAWEAGWKGMAEEPDGTMQRQVYTDIEGGQLQPEMDETQLRMNEEEMQQRDQMEGAVMRADMENAWTPEGTEGAAMPADIDRVQTSADTENEQMTMDVDNAQMYADMDHTDQYVDIEEGYLQTNGESHDTVEAEMVQEGGTERSVAGTSLERQRRSPWYRTEVTPQMMQEYLQSERR